MSRAPAGQRGRTARRDRRSRPPLRRPSRLPAAIRGMAALATLIALVAGLPVLLYRLGGSPIPSHLPGLHQIAHALGHRDNGTLFLATVRDIAWLAWAMFVVAVVSEVQAVVRGSAAPRLRLVGIQALAARLVVLAMLGLSGPAALATVAGAAPAAQAATRHPAAPPARQDPAGGAAGAEPELAAGPASHQLTEAGRPSAQVMTMSEFRLVTVRPGDCLWTIAEHYLGNGDLYTEIANLNLGRDMGGGVIFSDPSVIWPGWVLRLPHGSANGDGAAHRDGGPGHASGGHGGGQHSSSGSTGTGGANGHAGSGAGQHGTGRHEPHPSRHHRFSSPHPAASGTPAQVSGQGGTPGRHAAPAQDERHAPGIPPLAVFAAGMVAGGAAASLSRMRNRQRQSRRRGRRIPLPASAPVLVAEQRMHTDAGLVPANWLRAALSELGAGLAETGQQVPEIAAVRVRPQLMEILLASPASEPPPPPFAVPAGRQGMTWQLSIPPDAPEYPTAPSLTGDLAPGLVTLGVADGGYLLADLEYLGVTVAFGPQDAVDQVLATAAAELATSELAGWYDLILVGFPELRSASSRATCCDDLATALDLAAAKAVTLRRRLGDAGPAAVRRLRVADPADEDWALTLLVSAIAPTSAELALLTDLVSGPGGAAALLPAGDAHADSPGIVDLEIDYDDDQPGGLVARILPLNLQAYPQPLSNADYHALTSLFATAAREDDVAADDPPYDGSSWPPDPPPGLDGDGAAASGLAADAGEGEERPEPGHDGWRPLRTDGDTPSRNGAASVPDASWRRASAPEEPEPEADGDPASALRIGLLGTLTINGQPGALLPAQSQLIVALALSGREGMSNRQLCHVLGADPDHPRPPDSLRQLIVRTRRQLGTAPDGREWIEHLGGGQYALHPNTRVDWLEFREMTSDGMSDRDARTLSDALRMIRGQPFTGCYYWWLDIALVETVRAQIVDAADLLAELELAAGNVAASARAARIGLAADSAAEQLWRALMRAEHAAGNMAGVREAWIRCLEVISEIAADGQPHPETADLYRELLGGSPARFPGAWPRDR
jgi:DNA-binding SARP family transcriptional activator